MPRYQVPPLTVKLVQEAVVAYFSTHPMPGGLPPTDAQVQQAVQSYFAAHPVTNGTDGEDGKDATPEDIQAAVDAYMAEHPVKDGKDGDDATDDQIANAVEDYLTAHPPKDGKDGADATNAQVASAVATYLTANPPAKGTDGKNASDAQVASAVATYLTAHPPANGKSVSIAVINGAIQAQQEGGPWTVLVQLADLKGSPGNDGKSVELQKTSTAIQWRQVGGAWADLVALSDIKGNPGTNGVRGSLWSAGSGAPSSTSGVLSGDSYLDTATGDTYIYGSSWAKSGNIKGLQGIQGPSPLVSLGTVNVTQTAAVIISAGIRTLTFSGITGLLTTDNVLLFPIVTAGVGIPDGYAIHNAWCSAAGTIKVTLSAPLLAIGAGFSISCRVIVLR